MYAKALETETMWFTVSENPVTEKFELRSDYRGRVPTGAAEEYDTVAEVEQAMSEIAPLDQWSEEKWYSITE